MPTITYRPFEPFQTLTDEQDRENVVAFLATLRNAAGGGADATTQAKASRSD